MPDPVHELGLKVREEGTPDDENIYLDIPQEKATNAIRLWNGIVYWQCCECGCTNTEETDDANFRTSCPMCYKVNDVDIKPSSWKEWKE